jgi:hypothetical protein
MPSLFYILYKSVPETLVFSVYYSLHWSLLDSAVQQWMSPFLWAPKLSSCLSYSNSSLTDSLTLDLSCLSWHGQHRKHRSSVVAPLLCAAISVDSAEKNIPLLLLMDH